MSEIQDEDIITLTDENGNDVEFLLLDVVEYNNDDYMVMIPLDDEEIEDDDEQDEVVILKVIREGDEETYSGVEDEDVLNAVFEIFQEQNAEEDEALECTFQRFFRMQKAGTASVLPRLLVIISFPRAFPA